MHDYHYEYMYTMLLWGSNDAAAAVLTSTQWIRLWGRIFTSQEYKQQSESERDAAAAWLAFKETNTTNQCCLMVALEKLKSEKQSAS